MHLNNEQLLEPDDAGIQHLSECEECRLRSGNLSLIRSRLQSIPDKSTQSDQWQEIQRGYFAQSNSTELIAARRSRTFWKVATGAMAASFALFMIWQNYYQPIDADISSRNVVFAALIKENNALQQQLTEQLAVLQVPDSKTAGLLVELEVIDTRLQQAYLEKQSAEQKIHLWEQQQILLQTTLSAIKQPHVIRL